MANNKKPVPKLKIAQKTYIKTYNSILLIFIIIPSLALIAVSFLSLKNIGKIKSGGPSANELSYDCGTFGFSEFPVPAKLEVPETKIDEVRADAKIKPTDAANLTERLIILDQWRDSLLQEGINPKDCGNFLEFTNGDGLPITYSVSELEDYVKLGDILNYSYYDQEDPVEGKAKLMQYAFGSDLNQLYGKVDALFQIYEAQSGGQPRYLTSLAPASQYTYADRGVDLKDLAAGNAATVSPMTAGKYENSVEFDDVNCNFIFHYQQDKDLPMTYTWKPRLGTLNELVLEISGTEAISPTQGGGITAVFDNGVIHSYNPKASPNHIESRTSCNLKDNKTAEATFSWTTDTNHRPYTFSISASIQGKTLRVEYNVVDRGSATVSEFYAGWIRKPATFEQVDQRAVPVPYLGMSPVNYIRKGGYFVSRIIDWEESHATYKGTFQKSTEATIYDYTNNTRDDSIKITRPNLHEVLYVAASSELLEVLPTPSGQPTPYHTAMSDRIVFDEWETGNWSGLKDQVENMKQAGLEQLVMISHGWAGQLGLSDLYSPNRDLYNQIDPDGPQRVKYVQDVSQLIRDMGGLFAIHNSSFFAGGEFNKDDLNWNLENIVMSKPEGNPPTSDNRTMKASVRAKMAQTYNPDLVIKYGANAEHDDVSTCQPPAWSERVDHDVMETSAAQSRQNIDGTKDLFNTLRDIHQGPIFGEGRQHYHYGGYGADGVDAENVTINHGEQQNANALLVDFDLLKIHPLQANFGMGNNQRWMDAFEQPDGAFPRLSFCTNGLSLEQQDNYRSQEIAFGHVGYFATENLYQNNYAIREYYLVRGLQSRYMNSDVKDISYEINGKFEPASRAVVLGPLYHLRITYENGLTIWTNVGPENWKVNIPNQGEVNLPDSGFYAAMPSQKTGGKKNIEVYTAVVGKDENGGDLIGDYSHFIPAFKDDVFDYEIYFADSRSDFPSLTLNENGKDISCNDFGYAFKGSVAGFGAKELQEWLLGLYEVSRSEEDLYPEVLNPRDPALHANSKGSAITMGPITTNGIIRVQILKSSPACPVIAVDDLSYISSRQSRTHTLDLDKIITGISKASLVVKGYDNASYSGTGIDVASTREGSKITFKEIDDQAIYGAIRFYKISSLTCNR